MWWLDIDWNVQTFTEKKKKKIQSTYVRNPTQQCVLDEKQKGEGRKWRPVG